MTDKIAVTLSAEEYREFLMSRIERTLRETGVELSPATRARVLAQLPLPSDGDGAGTPSVSAPTRQAHPSAAAVDRLLKAHKRAKQDNRTRVYQPTAKAERVPDATSTADLALNAIIDAELCTLAHVEKATHRPKKALYTAIWWLHKEGLITITPLASVVSQHA